MRRIFHKLIPLEKAIEVIEQRIELKPRGIEKVGVLNALGRVLAEDIYAPIDYPPFDRSEVDGYALRAEDTYGADEQNPVKLQVIGSVSVGEAPNIEVLHRTAVEISTGAALPRGTNAVVMEEYTTRNGPEVFVYRAVAPLENIAIAGSDVPKGDLVLQKGTRLGPFEIGVLAALGYSHVEVFTRPRVAVISTGNEVAQPGTALRFGQVYDYNGYAVTAYLRSLGAHVEYMGIVPDDEEKLRAAILQALSRSDIVVTSGGTSAGLGDLVYRVVESLGEVLVHGLEIKPGKPTVIGVVKDKLVIGLPGFPFSASVITIALLRYVVEKMCGLQPTDHPYLHARLAQRIRKGVGKTWFLPVALTKKGDEFIAIPIPMRSGSIATLLRADGMAVLHRDLELVDEGQRVEVLMMRSDMPEAIIIGSHDILLPRIVAIAGLTQNLKIISVGSLAGLQFVAKGYGDIAPMHLLDPETRTYNVPYVARYRDIVLVSGYKRRIVLAFRRGNPKRITSLRDVLRNDIRFVNRNQGSGTRVLLDLMLRNIAEELGISFSDLVKRVNGYTYEVSSHTGVAAAIAQGRADMGLCIEYAARIYNLEFIPVAWEEYDFAVHKSSLAKFSVKRFIEYLRSEEARKIVSSLPGYQPKDDMGKVIEVNA